MFFRKKGKYTDVEGYNRISRLIEDRQREMAHGGLVEEEDFDDDAVLLSRGAPSRDRAGVRPVEEQLPPTVRVEAQPAVEQTLPQIQAISPAAGGNEERRIPFQTGVTETQPIATVQPGTEAALERPSMTVPDLGAPSLQGSLVAAEAVWEGKLATNGNVRVEGTVHGEVETASTLFVAANARIDGAIHARNILLAGEVEAQIVCTERLEILPGGSARGEIETGTLVVHEGAFIDSRFQMKKAESPARQRP